MTETERFEAAGHARPSLVTGTQVSGRLGGDKQENDCRDGFQRRVNASRVIDWGGTLPTLEGPMWEGGT